MANRVKSNNVIIEMLISGIYYPIFCGKTMEFVQAQEVIEVTSINNTIAREYEAGMTTGNLSITGVTILDNTGNRIAITYLMQEAIRRAAQTMRIRLIDDDGGALQIAFSAIIVNNTLSRSVGTYSQSSTQLIITGEPTLSAIIPPPGIECPEEPLYIDVVAGATSVHDVLLEQPGVVILGVARGPSVFQQVLGTPGNAQFRFGGVDGTLYFDTTNPFNAGEVIWVLYKL